ncbi:MAG: hypothetical protein ABI760_10830 [Ferruginibacter sp.]
MKINLFDGLVQHTADRRKPGNRYASFQTTFIRFSYCAGLPLMLTAQSRQQLLNPKPANEA